MNAESLKTATQIEQVEVGVGERRKSSSNASAVLVATVDATIRRELGPMLEMYGIKTLWARGVEEVRFLLAKEKIAVCFCGFWLVDGTYRDVVWQLKNQPTGIPAIIIGAPACPREFADYFASVRISSFDFMCHPYQKSDMERILSSALGLHMPVDTAEDLAHVA